jgi:tetratricopeptide (TPR) repeat protein
MNKKFQAVITLQEQMTKTSKDSSNFMQLERAIWRMEEFGAYPIACVGWRNAGIAARSHKQYTKATAYFEKALGLAKQFSIELMVRQTQLSIAVLNFHTNEPELAREQLDHIRFSGTLDPVLASKYEILTLLEVDSGNMELAMEHLKKALDISLELDHIVMVPDQCLYLGETYENHFHDLEKAEHYYRIGQEHSLRYAEHGISLTGDRKKVVDGHLRLLSSTTRQIAAPKKAPDYFSFAAGKSWRTIKDIFQHQLILYHSKEISKGKLLAAKLSMPPTTLYSLKTRLLERGYELVETTDNSSTSQHPAQEFIHEHNELSWAEINKIFEQEMIHYLYEKYGYNKHRMANILELSYPAIINKTRELTQVNEHFLPN